MPTIRVVVAEAVAMAVTETMSALTHIKTATAEATIMAAEVVAVAAATIQMVVAAILTKANFTSNLSSRYFTQLRETGRSPFLKGLAVNNPHICNQS